MTACTTDHLNRFSDSQSIHVAFCEPLPGLFAWALAVKYLSFSSSDSSPPGHDKTGAAASADATGNTGNISNSLCFPQPWPSPQPPRPSLWVLQHAATVNSQLMRCWCGIVAAELVRHTFCFNMVEVVTEHPDQSLSIHNMAVMFLDFLVMFKLIHCLEKAFGLRGPVESSSCKGRICLLHPWPRPGFQGWQLRDSKMTEFHRMFFFLNHNKKYSVKKENWHKDHKGHFACHFATDPALAFGWSGGCLTLYFWKNAELRGCDVNQCRAKARRIPI